MDRLKVMKIKWAQPERAVNPLHMPNREFAEQQEKNFVCDFELSSHMEQQHYRRCFLNHKTAGQSWTKELVYPAVLSYILRVKKSKGYVSKIPISCKL